VDRPHGHEAQLMPRYYFYIQALIVLFVLIGAVVAVTKLV
jgi:hypothetical protein